MLLFCRTYPLIPIEGRSDLSLGVESITPPNEEGWESKTENAQNIVCGCDAIDHVLAAQFNKSATEYTRTDGKSDADNSANDLQNNVGEDDVVLILQGIAEEVEDGIGHETAYDDEGQRVEEAFHGRVADLLLVVDESQWA